MNQPASTPARSWTLTRFFVPLAIQAASQALCYPLVAISFVATGFTLLKGGVPGHLIGPVGLTLGSLASSATMRVLLNRVKERAVPVGQTTTSSGQIR